MKPPSNAVPEPPVIPGFEEAAKVLDPPECPAELKGLELYEKDFKLWKRWDEFIAASRTAFPDIDLVAEIRKAHAWEIANKKRVLRKRYLNGWFGRAQDRTPRTPVMFEGKPRRQEPTAEDYQIPKENTP